MRDMDFSRELVNEGWRYLNWELVNEGHGYLKGVVNEGCMDISRDLVDSKLS